MPATSSIIWIPILFSVVISIGTFLFTRSSINKLIDHDLNNSLIEPAYDQIVEALALALDLRDNETAGHSQRVKSSFMDLMHATAYKPLDMKSALRGALLHDIGKMGVPDKVLRKNGKLNSDEWVEMRKHPDLARIMLSQVRFLEKSITIPYCHHERYDGTGYPRGLKDGEIPMEARIFSIVDVWDALTNDRIYREAYNSEDALEIIKAGRGTQFDPHLVDVFVRMKQDD